MWRNSPNSARTATASPQQPAANRVRRSTALGIVICLLATLTGCGHEIPDMSAAAEDLASALRNGTLDGLAFRDNLAVTDVQTEYRNVLTPLFNATGDVDPDVTVTNVVENVAPSEDAPRTATATFEWAWPIGDTHWTYTTQADMTLFEPAFGQAREPRWEINWDPNMLLPELNPGEVIDSRIVPPTRADILDGEGEPLVTERAVVHLGIDKATAIDDVQLSEEQLEAAAKVLARAVNNSGVHTVDVDAFIDKVAAAGPRDFVELIALRADDESVNVEHLLETAGIRADEAVLPLGPTDNFAAALLGTAEAKDGQVVGTSGLQQQYNDQLAGVPGIAVFASGPRGERELFTQDAQPGTPVETTLDSELQQRAEDLLSHVSSAAALVAIRPSTGELVAAATSPGSEGDIALTGQFAPGQAFLPVSALALARHGVTPTSTVTCEPSIEIDERPIQNFPDFPEGSLGEITFREAFIQSCNTAFVSEAENVTQADLVAAAHDLGFGQLSALGLPAFYGEIPTDADEVQHAASLLGQDRVLASPFAMARVAASIAKGERVDPILVRSEAEEAAAATGTDTANESHLTEAEATALRDLMRDWVQGDTTYYLRYIAGLTGAKAGTAQAAGGQTHAWIIGITNSASPVGELAIAIFVEVGQSGTATAAPLLYKFITGNEVPPPPQPVVVTPDDGGDGEWVDDGTGGGGSDVGGGGSTNGGGGNNGDGAYRPEPDDGGGNGEEEYDVEADANAGAED